MGEDLPLVGSWEKLGSENLGISIKPHVILFSVTSTEGEGPCSLPTQGDSGTMSTASCQNCSLCTVPMATPKTNRTEDGGKVREIL